MKAFATITPVYKPFCDACLVASWERSNPNIPLEVVVDQSQEAEGNADFRSAGFDRHVANKMLKLAALASNEPEPFLITDADVLYFGSVAHSVEMLMAPDVDLLIARESMGSGGFNIGQMIIRPSTRVVEFFEKVSEGLLAGVSKGRGGPANQDFLVAALHQTFDIRWRPLPALFATTAIDRRLRPELRKQLFSLHLTETWVRDGKCSLDQKWELLHHALNNHPGNTDATI